MSINSYDVVGIGRAFSDVIASVPLDFLKHYGIPYGSGKQCTPEELRQLRAELTSIDIMPGGAVANTLAGIAALGGKAGFMGKVADDEAGQAFIDGFKISGVDMLGETLVPPPAASPVCYILVTPDGERSFPLSIGCADDYHLNDFVAFEATRTKYFIVQGYMLFASVAAAMIREALLSAIGRGVCIVVSLSDIFVAGEHDAVVFSLIAAHAGIIIGNDEEMAFYKKAVANIAIQKPVAQLLVTTLGAQGAVAESATGEVRVPAQTPEKFVNLLGAGDQFLAGLLFGLSRDMSLQDSMQLGVRCATAILGEIGARPQIP